MNQMNDVGNMSHQWVWSPLGEPANQTTNDRGNDEHHTRHQHGMLRTRINKATDFESEPDQATTHSTCFFRFFSATPKMGRHPPPSASSNVTGPGDPEERHECYSERFVLALESQTATKPSDPPTFEGTPWSGKRVPCLKLYFKKRRGEPWTKKPLVDFDRGAKPPLRPGG